MDDPSIVKILVFMKEDETAAVLESFAKKGPAEAGLFPPVSYSGT